MRTIIYFALGVLFVIIYFPAFIVGWILSLLFDKKRVAIKHIARIFSAGLLVANPWWKIKMNGLENYDKNKTYLIVMNHRSLYDIALVNMLPTNMRWVAKYELYKLPILGPILYFKDDVMVKRGDPESTKKMMIKCFGLFKQDISVAIFPEGTRSKDGCVHDFKEGAFIIAKKGRVPILPIVVQGTWEAENRGKRGLLNPNTFTMDILPEITVEQIKEMGIKELCDYTHKLIYEKHKETSPELYN